MTVIAFDIETDPDPAKLDQLPIPTAPGNYRDPDKIADYIKNAQNEQTSRMALDPTFGRIVCVTFASPDRRDPNLYTQRTLFRTEDLTAASAPIASDKALIMSMIDTLLGADQLVSFNGVGFDFPFIVRRAMLNGMVVPAAFLDFFTHPYAAAHPQAYHHDTMLTLHALEVGGRHGSSPVKAARTLQYYAKHLLNRTAEHDHWDDKTRIASLFAAGDLAPIETICAWDATSTLHLHELLCTYFPVHFPEKGDPTNGR